MTEYILLGFLMERNMTGYDMKQHMSFSTSYFMDASFGSIYPALKRLTEKGYIDVMEVSEGGKLKKVYSITENGKIEFLKWLDLPIDSSKSSISPALVKIFFYRYLSAERVQELIGQYIEDIKKYKIDILNLKSKIDTKLEKYERSTMCFGLDFYDFIIQWYENNFEHK